MGSNPVLGNSLFPKQEILHTFLSTGWLGEQIQVCIYTLIASYTNKLHVIYILYKLNK